jgi:hypothetical protein
MMEVGLGVDVVMVTGLKLNVAEISLTVIVDEADSPFRIDS